MDAVVLIADFSIEDVLVQNDGMRCVLEAKDHQIKPLEEKINYLLHYRFGLKSERFYERQQLIFENENATCEAESSTEMEVLAHTRRLVADATPPRVLNEA
ncbi:MAG: hypothetical protein ABW168_01525 [Sedimenticola sp.]